MKTPSNLPPGCTEADIDRAAGANLEIVSVVEFESELVRETAYGSTPIGLFKNRMEFQLSVKRDGFILWTYGQQQADEDETEIGLEIEGKKITGYDGVFSLPVQALDLLAAAGYDISEVDHRTDDSQRPSDQRPADPDREIFNTP